MAETTAAPTYQSVPLIQVDPSRHQARKNFDEQALKNLADSMKAEGLIQPITVRQVGERYELIAGERRFRAAKLLGWEVIDAKVIQTVSEAETAAKGLVENLQREDLNPIDEASGFAELNKLDNKYWDQPQISKVSGRTQGYISQSLKLLQLPQPVKESISRLILSRSHALELMRLDSPEKQIKAAKEMETGKLNRSDARKLVRRMTDKIPASAPKETPPDPLADLWTTLTVNPAIAPINTWGVSCGKSPTSIPAWMFWFSVNTPTPKATLKRWFQALADAMGDTHEEEEAAHKIMDAAPINSEELQQIELEGDGMRLPQTTQEWAQVEALAQKGPGAIYAWALGENSLAAEPYKSMTW